jgi:hypothetical protein
MVVFIENTTHNFFNITCYGHDARNREYIFGESNKLHLLVEKCTCNNFSYFHEIIKSELKVDCSWQSKAIKIHVAVDECDFRIYCGVLDIQNRRTWRSRSRENTALQRYMYMKRK